MRKLAKISATVCATLAFTGVAYAGDWQTSEAPKEGWNSVISTTDNHSLLLSCTSSGRLDIVIDFEGSDIISKLSQQTLRRRFPNVAVTIGERDSFNSSWIYLPSQKIAVPRRKPTISKLYNAMVRGDSVTLDMDGKAEISFTFPSMNDAFVDLAGSCPATQPKSADE